MTDNKILSSLIYKFIERIGYQGISLLVSIILARILGPSVYGTIAILLVFTTFAQVFVQCGLNYALVQRKEVTSISYTSVFYMTMLIACVLYIILYISAPVIASYYNNEALSLYLRVLSIILFPSAYNSIQNAIITRNLQFKKLLISNIIAIVLSSVLSIPLAFCGLGIWTLIAQQILINFISCIILSLMVDWKPSLDFDKNEARFLFNFGWKLLLGQLLVTVYEECTTIIIGKNYSSSVVGYYNKGSQFPKLLAVNINSSIQSVIFPVLSKEQESLSNVDTIVKKALNLSSFVISPILIGLLIVSPPFIEILLGNEWIPCVQYLQLMCLFYIFQPIATAYVQAIMAVGRANLAMWLSIIKALLGVLSVVITSIIFNDVVYIVFVLLFNQLLYTVALAISYAMVFKNNILNHLWKIIPNWGLTVIMAIPVFGVSAFISNPWLLLIVQVGLGIIIYVFTAAIFQASGYRYLMNLAHRYLSK